MNEQLELLQNLGLSKEQAISFMKSTLNSWIDVAQDNIDDCIDFSRIADALTQLKNIEL